MATSGTYNFNPSIGELVLTAYGRLGVRRTAITQEHMEDAKMAVNLLLSRWTTQNGPNLWKVELQPIVLVPGIATYDLPKNVSNILDAYIRTGDNPPQDRIITSISRSQYAGFPNKVTPGLPTVYWFDRQISPRITLWQPPNDQQVYTLRLYVELQIQDGGFADGQQPDIPYRFLSAFVSGLAAELARSYRPEIVPALEAIAQKDWTDAAQEDVENAPLGIGIQVQGYYR